MPYTDGKLNGVVQNYSSDGSQLTGRIPYAHGAKQGVEEDFDAATGKKIAHAEWDNNQLNGEMTVWDVQGNVVKHVIYDHGTDVEVEKQGALRQQQEAADAQALQDSIAECEKAIADGRTTREAATVAAQTGQPCVPSFRPAAASAP
ncbi:toxin-antitoxin system YwqK family antitoxin [Paraburkholderia graminis]|uniref:toxin-antitoxin system YwqK family antitoxin n=1 Tax=Paraburkholderia graminis TaxID=60548 RepID=UPI002790841D|nr:hypothetical protein [Paraburkholderia graminis]MDQ0627138.1 hypothetical protein [Paraburkholderia graminis]